MKYYKQQSFSTCGPTCLRMIFSYKYPYKRESFYKELCLTENIGTSIDNLQRGVLLLNKSSIIYYNSSLKIMINYLNKNYKVIVLFKYHYCIVKKINHKFIYLWDPSR